MDLLPTIAKVHPRNRLHTRPSRNHSPNSPLSSTRTKYPVHARAIPDHIDEPTGFSCMEAIQWISTTKPRSKQVIRVREYRLRVNATPSAQKWTVAFQCSRPSSERWIAQSERSFRSNPGMWLELEVKDPLLESDLEPRPSSSYLTANECRCDHCPPAQTRPGTLGSPLHDGYLTQCGVAAHRPPRPSALSQQARCRLISLAAAGVLPALTAEDRVSTSRRRRQGSGDVEIR